MRECRIKAKDVDIAFDYIRNCTIDHSFIHGYLNKTLIIEFKRPLNIVSTLEGLREDVRCIGNHYAPIECWKTGHENGGMDALMKNIYRTLGLAEDVSSLLFTGADVENVSVTNQCYRATRVCALVTAGVKSNAVRVSQDEGDFYEHGTINIIILTNMSLSPKATTGAIITATEAKTAALQDLDIRSSYTPLVNQATGTGTDNIIIAQGEGLEIGYSGAHTKIGEIIGKAVYNGVREAAFKQNGITGGRDPFQRLTERGFGLIDVISNSFFDSAEAKSGLSKELEAILLEHKFKAFIESSFSISDHYEKGLISNLDSFRSWCKIMGESVSGREIKDLIDFFPSGKIPDAIRMALNYLINGLYLRQS